MYDIVVKLIADYAVIAVVVVAVGAIVRYVPKGSRYRVGCQILMAGLTAYLIAKLVAFAYQPETQRPYQQLGVEPGASYLDNPGFPSDHALFVTAVALAAWATTKRRWVGGVLGILVVLVCVGRVSALVHTPLDVIAGVGIALVGGLWYLQDDRTVTTGRSVRRKRFKKT